jgi:hypothetical protein
MNVPSSSARAAAGAAAAAGLLLVGCAYISFSKPMSDEEYILRSEVRGYYSEVSEAFAGGNADALAQLFDESIAKPMTRDQILAWGRDFFQKHGPAKFQVEKLEVESLGHVNGVVRLTYRVDTSDGQGSFRGVERDELLKHGRRWYVSGWEKLPDRP